ncbi:MAG: GTPase HflX [Thaumarchaeota archaeon]|nr:GTPase HflX [Nitrososphaerota archaeon]MDD9809882.1 GTPase HflX [Nitrososphaerota archaeon]MDD9842976.1 GTPase HflX [Nitrososphaerota archaeon]RNJ71332.1 MAG: GTPase HflX [Thaumarchaeota archaeon S14]RNJ76547.1 MAG: GTPase HflX [Thaumarchaeota archaeon S15]
MAARTAILVTRPLGDGLEEAVALCEAAGYSVVSTVSRGRSRRAKYGLGEGTVERLEEAAGRLGPDVVVLDELLKPSQNYNLASRLHTSILDREALILEIFGRRATSDESRLQVRLAQMRYEMSRARESVRLAKMGEQPGFMGIGKFGVDVYYDDIRHRMESVRARLRGAARRRELHRRSRERLGLRTISLAGYTSAGKTTLFNALTGEDRQRGEEPFTTLSTTVRRARIGGTERLVSDTVGFITELPAYMIEAFKSTLEEMTHADAIILVLDASDPAELAASKLSTCRRTLGELDVQPARVVIALNKADLVDDAALGALEGALGLGDARAVRVSSLERTGLDGLGGALEEIVGNGAA